ncbi:hypothetical protein B484DRAFT_429886 [Ochromonadaceae sp. CCMP2298]|nr:hypothetical protein B484DRAFT_429886 [Ochromonadaceae sp. CCMP2298]
MKNLVKEAVAMQDKLLEYRYNMRKGLANQAQEDEKSLTMATGKSTSGLGAKSKPLPKAANPKNDKESEANAVPDEDRAWENTWSVISSRTGIIEPQAFFERINNSTALVEQIRTIKKASEARLETMKKEVVVVEAELEEVRYTASLAGVTTNKEYQKQLGEKQGKLRQIKEKTEAVEQLQQGVVAGLAHISDILFIPKSEDDAPVSDLHKNIEAVLDTLINEREKQLQQQQQGAAQGQADSQSKVAGTRDSTGMPETYTNRSPELDFVIAKHEAPTVRLPYGLPSRPKFVEEEEEQDYVDGEEPDEGVLDRLFVKAMSINNVRKHKHRTDESKLMIATM